MTLYDLTTEYLHNPLGVDAKNPRFAWKIKAEGYRNVRQKSYHIIVRDADQSDRILWDSGVVLSDRSVRVRYEGKTLKSRERLVWTVEVVCTGEPDVIDCRSAYEFQDEPDGGAASEKEAHSSEKLPEEIELSAVSEPAFFEMGLLSPYDWQAKWIDPETEVDRTAKKPVPDLRRRFTVKPGLLRARIYSSAHGLYEQWVNGALVTEDKFKPGLTSYYYRIQYQAYDITHLLQPGENVLSLALGDGWWRGSVVKNNFGYRLAYLGQIELYYEDGSHEIIGSDEQFVTKTGGLLSSDMVDGDVFDACIERTLGDWKNASFDDSDWKPVQISSEHTDAELIASRSVPVREKEQFEGKAFTDPSGKLVIDFGQNIAGYVRMKLRNTAEGQRIHLQHGEALDLSGCFSVDNVNGPEDPLHKELFQEVTYICCGDAIEAYCPMFSVFGFRYVLLEGYDPGKIQPGDFTAVAVYSDMEETGDFTCSNPLLNQLVRNARWSQKGNFLDVAVDCPTRERNAWTGDSQVYSRTAADFMNVYPFFEKWLQDQAIEQYESGKLGITFPSTSSIHNPEELAFEKRKNPQAALAGPSGDGNIGEDCAGWGDSAVWNPYMMYLCYGDPQILENQYDCAKKWTDYMLRCAKEHNEYYESEPQYHSFTDGELDAEYIYDTRMHYGEWSEPMPMTLDPRILQALQMAMTEDVEKNGVKDLNSLSPEEAEAEKKRLTALRQSVIYPMMAKLGKPLVATAYMKRSCDNLAHMAKILGKTEDAKKYAKLSKRIRSVYSRYLIGEDGVIEPGHQAAYVRAIAFDLAEGDKLPLVKKQLIGEVEKNGFRLNTGFLSTPFLLQVLCDIGETEAAYRILESTESPGWLRSILFGATTIPESWDGFEKFHASLNHYSFGAVCNFLFEYTAGIRPSFDDPGYHTILLRPVPGGTITEASGRQETMYGTVRSSWKIKGESFVLACEIPANTEALVVLPDGTEYKLGSGCYRFCCLRQPSNPDIFK